MADQRRALIEGLNTPSTKPHTPAAEAAFVYGRAAPAASPPPASRSPLTTRLRADLAAALKRASLERQLAGQTPCEIQELLDAALEPWLKQHGYL